MKRWFAAAAAVAIAFGLWTLVRSTTPSTDLPDQEQPENLLALSAEAVDGIAVATADGRCGVLTRGADGFTVTSGASVAAADIERMTKALFPLLAVRTLDADPSTYGLDDPRLELTITADGMSHHVRVGAANFDETADYVDVDGAQALVVRSIAEVADSVATSAACDS